MQCFTLCLKNSFSDTSSQTLPVGSCVVDSDPDFLCLLDPDPDPICTRLRFRIQILLQSSKNSKKPEFLLFFDFFRPFYP
jgi:hypothetical protein